MGLGAREGFFLLWLSFILYLFIFLSNLLICGLVGSIPCSEQECSCAKALTESRGSSPEAFCGANTALKGISAKFLTSYWTWVHCTITSLQPQRSCVAPLVPQSRASRLTCSPMEHTGIGVLLQPALPPWTGVHGISSILAEWDQLCWTSEEPFEMLVYFLTGTIRARWGNRVIPVAL